jgi:hypothetical protein
MACPAKGSADSTGLGEIQSMKLQPDTAAAVYQNELNKSIILFSEIFDSYWCTKDSPHFFNAVAHQMCFIHPIAEMADLPPTARQLDGTLTANFPGARKLPAVGARYWSSKDTEN